jgi:hypothetical protein
MLGFNPGDIVVAYLKRRGFVGIGKFREIAKPISKVETKKIIVYNPACSSVSGQSA